ncbi:MAG: RDD family protein [Candidatus Limnocylindria bacterium]
MTRSSGLLRRTGAAGLDYLVIVAWVGVVTVIGAVARTLAPGVMDGLFASPIGGELAGFMSLTMPVALYFIVLEASPSGGTWGKRRLGLRVTTVDGERIGLRRSAARTILKLLPWELSHFAIWQLSAGPSVPPPVPYIALIVVWVLVGASLASVLVSRRKRAIYDFAAGTVVTFPG